MFLIYAQQQLFYGWDEMFTHIKLKLMFKALPYTLAD
jgi:hypothetical protein